MENGQSIDLNQLAEILGGPDAILQHYLSSNISSSLTLNQLNDINDLITNNKQQDWNTTLVISCNNSFLHHLLGDTPANKIVSIIYSKSMVIATGIATAILLSLVPLSFLTKTTRKDVLWMDITFCVISSIFTLLLLLSILSVNKTILNYILRTFIFYFKALYGIKYGICSAIYQYRKLNSKLIVGQILTVVLIVWYALMDGINASIKTKIWFGIMGSIYFLFISFIWTIESEQCLISINWWGLYSTEFDMREWAASAVRVVTIFMVEQTAYSMWKPSKSTLIRRSVDIVWSQR